MKQLNHGGKVIVPCVTPQRRGACRIRTLEEVKVRCRCLMFSEPGDVSCGPSGRSQALGTSTHISAGTRPTSYKTVSANSALALGKEPTRRLLQDRCHMEPDHELASTQPAGIGGVGLRAKMEI